MNTDKNCSDCGATFNPSREGIVGGNMAFCGPCCQKDEGVDCMACGGKAPHVDTVNGWCDACHDDYRVFNDMADRMNNGASFLEA